MTDFFLLSTCLVLSQYAAPNNGGKMAEAVYKDRGMEKNMAEYIERQTSESLRLRAGQLMFMTRTLIDQKIVYEVHF